jgi:hypothetical protein
MAIQHIRAAIEAETPEEALGEVEQAKKAPTKMEEEIAGHCTCSETNGGGDCPFCLEEWHNSLEREVERATDEEFSANA